MPFAALRQKLTPESAAFYGVPLSGRTIALRKTRDSDYTE
jgi:hypothetical protein